MDERFLAALDWRELTARLAAAAESPAGRARCLTLVLLPTADEARRRMSAVADLARLLAAEQGPPSLVAPEIEAAIASAEKGIVLGADELRPVAALAATAEAARQWFARLEAGGDAMVDVAALLAELDPPAGLARTIEGTFDPSGEISDWASPELARLREERRGLSDHARTAIESLMLADEYASVLQDEFFTIRAERYVLPLRASAKSMGLGIVHDTSRTGETVFVEPTALVAANNRLKVVELDIRRESRRILEALTAEVAVAAPALRRTAEGLAALDALAASARLGLAYGGVAIDIVDEPVIDLRAARHPLLALAHRPEAVVANDVTLGGAAAPILIVSGPNAGGKTVLGKTLGLAALMTRAGLLVAADRGSRIGFFRDVRADVGDRQSVLGDLSTFSGHLAAVRDILAAGGTADGEGPTLVLLDELMAGTNPEQGAALARATAETLAERPVLAIITTHYDSLKALGETDPRFANAGMEYDLEHLLPTFRLALGAPGRSYAFDIAARMGLPEALLDRARALVGAPSMGLESVIARLEARDAELARESERLSDAEAAASASAEAQRVSAAALARRELELGHAAREAVEAAIAETRAALAAITRRAQEAGSAKAAETGRAELVRVAAEALAKLPGGKPAAASAGRLALGARVRVERLGIDGELAQLPDVHGRAKVRAGKLMVDVGADELQPSSAPPPREPRQRPRDAGPPRASAGELALVSVTGAPRVDLRGQTGDEALAAVEAALDRATLAGESHVIVIHGHGTGALRKRVRAYLEESRYVARWAPGSSHQGGDGVSVVELR